MKIEDVLVPVDFSSNSMRAIEFAISLVDPGGEIYLLHVIDSGFIERLTEEGFGDSAETTGRMRRKAEARLQEILDGKPEPSPRMDSMIVVGNPVAEILRVAADLDFQMIVLGTHGRNTGNIEELLFGSTAEKVLRGARIPVICVPDADY